MVTYKKVNIRNVFVKKGTEKIKKSVYDRNSSKILGTREMHRMEK